MAISDKNTDFTEKRMEGAESEELSIFLPAP